MKTTTKSSATHAGCCQVCESLQLLPGGRLSKHGYTVALGFFNGECYGSGELPFEQSIALVLDSIERATEHRRQLDAQITELQQPVAADASSAWAHLYRPATFKRGQRHSSYEWHRVELRLRSTTIGGREFTDIVFDSPIADEWRKTQIVGRDYPVGGYPKTVADAVAAMNVARVEFLQRVVADVERYIGRQRARIRDWKPSELLPRAKYPKLR